MADFCRQCSEDTFGADTRDLADIVTEEEAKRGFVVAVICEGCGPTWVHRDGTCTRQVCDKGHV